MAEPTREELLKLWNKANNALSDLFAVSESLETDDGSGGHIGCALKDLDAFRRYFLEG